MSKHRIAITCLFSVLLVLGLAGSGWSYTLSLETQAQDANNTIQDNFNVGESFTLNINVDDARDIAGCAFTLEYSSTVLAGPTTNSEGEPLTTGITSSFPFSYETTQTHRENASETGRIYFSGATIDTTDGGPRYDTTSTMTLFSVQFKVRENASVGDNYGFALRTTMLDNPAAGYGDGAGGKDPVDVLVGALSSDCTSGSPCDMGNVTNGVWGGDLSDDFPVLLATIDPEVTHTGQVYIVPEISGVVSYTGKASGTLYVAAFTDTSYRTDPDATPVGAYSTTVNGGGGTLTSTYQFTVPMGTYYVASYIDTDGDDEFDMSVEPFGEYGSNPVDATTSDATNINFTVEDKDSDSDNLPDWYEMQVAGNLTTLDGTSDSNDADGDGYSDLDEYNNGTDPYDTTNLDPQGLPGYSANTDSRLVGSEYQTISLSPETNAVAVGTTFTVTVAYNTSDGLNASTGVGFYVHFDSSKLDYMGYANFLDKGGTQVKPDVASNETSDDGDPNTDKRLTMAWNDTNVQWPGENLPTTLVELGFQIKAPFNGTTALNVSSDVPGSGYDYVVGQGATANVQDWHLDVDGDGDVDAMTDGVMAVRYMLYTQLGILGPGWSANLFNASGDRNTEALVEAWLDDAYASSLLDVDGDGDQDAMTDGVMVVRYELYTQLGILGPGWSANLFNASGDRNTEALVQTYLDTLMLAN